MDYLIDAQYRFMAINGISSELNVNKRTMKVNRVKPKKTICLLIRHAEGNRIDNT